MRHRTRHEREQLELFRALPGDLAPRDAQDLMAYPFFSLAKTHRTTPIDFRMNEIAIRVEAVPEHGMATIWGRVPTGGVGAVGKSPAGVTAASLA
jgi:plasmid replication initiation protein